MALYTHLLCADDIANFNHYLCMFSWNGEGGTGFDHCRTYTPGNEMKVRVKPFSGEIVLLNNLDKCEIFIRPLYYYNISYPKPYIMGKLDSNITKVQLHHFCFGPG